MVTKESGSSLIEVVIALMVIVVVLGALVVAILTGLKNAQFAQSQTKATKYAQEAIDKVRLIRDRDKEGSVEFYYGTGGSSLASQFSDLWTVNMFSECTSTKAEETNKCYFQIDDNGKLIHKLPGYSNPIGDDLSLQVILTNSNTSDVDADDYYTKEKTVMIKVIWEDTSGLHESNLETKLTPI